MMTISMMQMNHPISMRDMINLDDPGNILLENKVHIFQYHNILLSKISGVHLEDAEIHIRFRDGDSIQNELNIFEQFANAGAQVTMWATTEELSLVEPTLNRVIIRPSHPIAGERFLIIVSPAYIRALLSWEAEVQTGNRIRGVLATNPLEMNRLLSKIHANLKK